MDSIKEVGLKFLLVAKPVMADGSAVARDVLGVQRGRVEEAENTNCDARICKSRWSGFQGVCGGRTH